MNIENTENEKRYEENLTEIMIEGKDHTNISAIRIEQADSSETTRIHMNSLEKYLEIPKNKLNTGITKCQNYGMPIGYADMMRLCSAIHDNYFYLKLIPYIKELGIQKDNSKIYYAGTSVLDIDGNDMVKDINSKLPTAKGEFESTREILKRYHAKKVKRQIILLYALSAIICATLDENAILFVIGTTSTGKSTAAKLGNSIHAGEKYGRIYKTFLDTLNHLRDTLSNIYGLGVVIDDTSLANKQTLAELVNFIYCLKNGETKGRMKYNEPGEKNRFATSFILSSEKSILFAEEEKAEGVVGRFFELNVSENDLFDSAKQANEMQKHYKSNYGVIGAEFVRRLLKVGYNNQIIEEKHLAETDAIREKAISNTSVQELIEKHSKTKNIVDRAIEDIAIITLTAKLANELLKFEFDTDKVCDYMIETFADNIMDFINMRNSNQVHTTSSGGMRKAL